MATLEQQLQQAIANTQAAQGQFGGIFVGDKRNLAKKDAVARALDEENILRNELGLEQRKQRQAGDTARGANALARASGLDPSQLSVGEQIGLGSNLHQQALAGVSPQTSVAPLLGNPDVPVQPGIRTIRDQQALAQQAAAEQAQQLHDLAVRNQKIALATNQENFERHGFSAEQIGDTNMNFRKLTRGLATIDELATISTMDVNTLKGGGAAMVKYMQQTLQPAIMEMINTGVINGPGEQARVDSFNAQIAGWEGLTTWSTTQQAQLNEMRRWFANQASDMAASFAGGIDPAAYSDSYQPRSRLELEQTIQAFDLDTPTQQELSRQE